MSLFENFPVLRLYQHWRLVDVHVYLMDKQPIEVIVKATHIIDQRNAITGDFVGIAKGLVSEYHCGDVRTHVCIDGRDLDTHYPCNASYYKHGDYLLVVKDTGIDWEDFRANSTPEQQKAWSSYDGWQKFIAEHQVLTK